MENSIETTKKEKIGKEEKNGPMIYAACLASYVNGKLYGRWIDACQPPEAILEDIQAMLESSPEPGAEEYAFHDYSGFGSFHLAEYDCVETVSALAMLINEFGEKLASHVWGRASCDAAEARRLLEECYQGSWKSLTAWAEDLLENTGEPDQVPEHLRAYIDVESYARDLELNGRVVQRCLLRHSRSVFGAISSPSRSTSRCTSSSAADLQAGARGARGGHGHLWLHSTPTNKLKLLPIRLPGDDTL